MTSDDFKELGGVRLMTHASETVFVFGEWASGFYPLTVTFQDRRHALGTADRWIVHLRGYELVEQPTWAMMTRLLKLLNIKEPAK